MAIISVSSALATLTLGAICVVSVLAVLFLCVHIIGKISGK